MEAACVHADRRDTGEQHGARTAVPQTVTHGRTCTYSTHARARANARTPRQSCVARTKNVGLLIRPEHRRAFSVLVGS
eukprot:1265510-Pyramimonas_sp.AAC.1